MISFSLMGREPRASWRAPVLCALLLCAFGAGANAWLMLDALAALSFAAGLQLLSLLCYLGIGASLYFTWRRLRAGVRHFAEFPGALPQPETAIADAAGAAGADDSAIALAELAAKRITARNAVRRRMGMH